MKNITLKFTPLEDYFFGKENEDKNGEQNYFLKSNYLPQVTTILGVVRYWLLVASGKLINGRITDKTKAETIIGKQSFTLDGSFDFGMLKNVSNLFLLNSENKKLIPAPLWLDEENTQFNWDHTISAPILPTYSPKKDYPLLFSDGTKENLFSEIFEQRESSHNRKNNREPNDKEAYFKLLSFTLKNGFSFGVNIELDDKLELNHKDTYIFKLGGENKLFKVEVITDALQPEKDILKKYANNKYIKLTFTSDAYLENFKRQDYLFGIITTKNFRSLFINNNNANNYTALDKSGKDKTQITKSKLFQIIEAGSVIYFENEGQSEAFIQKYLKNEPRKKAGFNHFVLQIPKN